MLITINHECNYYKRLFPPKLIIIMVLSPPHENAHLRSGCQVHEPWRWMIRQGSGHLALVLGLPKQWMLGP